MTTEVGPVELEVPRDRDGSFAPKTVRKRQRRMHGVDEMVLSLAAKGCWRNRSVTIRSVSLISRSSSSNCRARRLISLAVVASPGSDTVWASAAVRAFSAIVAMLARWAPCSRRCAVRPSVPAVRISAGVQGHQDQRRPCGIVQRPFQGRGRCWSAGRAAG